MKCEIQQFLSKIKVKLANSSPILLFFDICPIIELSSVRPSLTILFTLQYTQHNAILQLLLASVHFSTNCFNFVHPSTTPNLTITVHKLPYQLAESVIISVVVFISINNAISYHLSITSLPFSTSHPFVIRLSHILLSSWHRLLNHVGSKVNL